jgi:FkbM family methyltransferase
VRSAVSKLRPAKVRNALSRRWFEWRLARVALATGPRIVELGTAYGGWQIPDGLLGPESICYCVGAGGDISFDLELISRYGATVRAVEPVESYQRDAVETAAGEPRFSIRQAAVAIRDGPIRMQSHHQPGSASLSAAGLYETDSWVEIPGRTLASLMGEWGDERIDLLKLDLEGIEYELVPTLDLGSLGVRIFAVQLHHIGGVRGAMRLIDGVRSQGFRIVAQRPSVKVTFLRG